jgi:hypothetical protein
MHDMAAHREGRGPFCGLQLLGRLERRVGDGATLDSRQNARWRHGDGRWMVPRARRFRDHGRDY